MSTTSDKPRHDSSTATDGVLVSQVLEGDTAAFGEIVNRHAGLMRAYASRLMGSLSEADDVVQNAFITAWRRMDTLREADALKAWLMRIVSREAFTQMRKRPGDLPLAGYDATSPEQMQPEERAVHNEELRALSRALDKLPDEQRQCWVLRQIAELSYAEIAEHMNTSPSTARGLLARARLNISTQMGSWR